MRQKLTRRPSHTTITAYLALFVALGGTTYAATGGNFILGQSNSASSTTALSSGTTGPALKVTSTNTTTGATALGLNVATGHVPFTVNSGTKVAKLNADKLDGKDITNWKVTDIGQPSGPLPTTLNYQSSGGPFLIMVSGSGYRASTNNNPGRIGMDVIVDGFPVGQAYGFANEFESHKTFVPQFIRDTEAAGLHTIQLAAKTQSNCGTSDTVNDFCTTTDSSDYFDIAVIEIPF